MTESPGSRMPREEWDALVRGDRCPFCRDIAADVRSNEHGYKIADLRISTLWLPANQSVKGYCVVICRDHVSEPYHLSREDRSLFFEDMMSAAQAVEVVFHPIKMNFTMLGNLLPHLHCHVLPRYYGDPAPGEPIDPTARRLLLTPPEYEQRAELIRAALR